MFFTKILTLLTMTFLLIIGSVLAEVPNTINYQGSLTDGAGDPVTSTVSMTFTIFDDATVGSSQWSEIHPAVSVTDGLFDVVFGEGTPAVPITNAVFSGSNRWLEIEVASETITPRIQLVTVPYAFRVATVDGASGGVISGKLNIGSDNTNAGNSAFVAGESGEASGDYATVGGGYGNEASGIGSTVGGGTTNTANEWVGTVGGGEGNSASGASSTVGGGGFNAASGASSTVGGGSQNSNAGNYSTISGGSSNNITATADYSYLFGIQSTLTEDSTFMVDMPHIRFGDETDGYEIPSSDGTADQVLQTDGSGQVSWATVSGGGSSNWSVTDSVLYTNNYLGIARGGADNKLWSNGSYSHVNLGVACTTGANGGFSILYSTVGGGNSNTASNVASTVGGGTSNTANGENSTVGGGNSNIAGGHFSTVGGGNGNTASGNYSIVSSGYTNEVSGYGSTIGGGLHNSNAGDYSIISGGYADTITATADYSYLFGIQGTLTEDSTFMVDMPHIRFGDETNGYEIPSSDGTADQVLQTDGSGQVSWATTTTSISSVDGLSGGNITSKVSIGLGHTLSGDSATISGGSNNTASGSSSVVSGGLNNTASADYSSVGGGYSNEASGIGSTVGGGTTNTANEWVGTIGGGEGNTASGASSTVGGGGINTASGANSTVGGGSQNSNEGDYSTISGGYADTITATADYSYLFGIQSKLTEDSTFMVDMPHIRFGDEANGYEIPSSDGTTDQVLQTDGSGQVSWATIGGTSNWSVTDSVLYTYNNLGIARGGADNKLWGTNSYSHVNLGVACTTGVVGSINKAYATVGGGRFNTASGTGSTVGGGESNTTSDWYSSVGGGLDNEASGLVSTIGGGSENSNAGDHSTIAGGYADTISATADYSYLFGIGSKLTEDSTFMVDMPHIRLGDEATGYEIPSSRGTVDQVLQTDGSGQVSWATVSSGGDDLGDHTATQNVELSDNWLSNDGDSEGLFVDTDGDVGVGTNTPDARLHIVGQTIIDGSTLEFVNTGSSVFIGEDAGANDDYTTNSNTGIGNIALRDNISGFFNTAVGSGALANNLEDHNTAFGMSSLLYNTSGGENTGIGRAALQSNTTGDNNTGLGFWTDVGSNNLTNATAIGAYAYVTQSNSLILGSINGVNTATADTKVGIGTTSPYYKFEVQGATGSNNWIAKINNISNDNTTYNNGLLIQAGHDSYNSSRGSNMLTFSRPDGAPMGAVIQNGSTSISYYSISDRRQKSNIRTTDYGLNNLLQIQVADYEYKDNSATTQTGFIAQQLYEHYPEAVSVGGDDLEANPWMVAYGKMTPLLVKAVQEQQETIEELKAEVEELKKMVQQLAGQ